MHNLSVPFEPCIPPECWIGSGETNEISVTGISAMDSNRDSAEREYLEYINPTLEIT